MGLRREARHVADRANDFGGQYGTHAEDLGEGGARGLHLEASTRRFRSAIFLSSVLMSGNTSEAKRRLRRAEVPLGRMPRRMRPARSAESDLATPPGRRSLRSACRRFSALVRSATRSISLSESRR